MVVIQSWPQGSVPSLTKKLILIAASRQARRPPPAGFCAEKVVPTRAGRFILIINYDKEPFSFYIIS